MSGWRRATPAAVQGTSARIAIERPALPPPLRRAGVAGNDPHSASIEAKALEVFVDARQPVRVAIERDEVDVGKFEKMRRLAARCRARIEHALAGDRREQRRSELRAQVLDREDACIEARQGAHVHRRVDDDAVVACRDRVDVRLDELRQAFVSRRKTPVDAKRQWRVRISAASTSCQSAGSSRSTRSIHHWG
jgi:hypothetical protein